MVDLFVCGAARWLARRGERKRTKKKTSVGWPSDKRKNELTLVYMEHGGGNEFVSSAIEKAFETGRNPVSWLLDFAEEFHSQWTIPPEPGNIAHWLRRAAYRLRKTMPEYDDPRLSIFGIVEGGLGD